MRLLAPALVLCSMAAFVQAAGVQKYGKPLTLKTETKITDILAKPDAYVGKRLRVRAVVTDVCPERGCYMILKGEKRFQSLMFKVDDGVIVFPVSLVGREVIVEGTLSKQTISVQEQKDMCPVEAKALDPKFDPEKITGPMVLVRLDGIGAEAR